MLHLHPQSPCLSLALFSTEGNFESFKAPAKCSSAQLVTNTILLMKTMNMVIEQFNSGHGNGDDGYGDGEQWSWWYSLEVLEIIKGGNLRLPTMSLRPELIMLFITHTPTLTTPSYPQKCASYTVAPIHAFTSILHHIYNLHTCIRLCTANLLRYILCNMISCIHANPPQIIVTNSGHCICDPSPMSKRFPETRTSRGSREISRGQISQ